jgi:hypothetical protein
MKEELTSNFRAGAIDVRALTTLGTFDRTNRRKQRERLNSKYHKKPSNGEEGETKHRHRNHNPRKRRNDGTPVGYFGRIALRREQCGVQTHC